MPRQHGESPIVQKSSDPHRAARPRQRRAFHLPTRSHLAPLLIALLLVGCQNQKKDPAGNKAAPVANTSTAPNSSDPVDASDRCAAQMHDIEGAMLQYYALNHRLPEHLQELSTFADPDQTLVFTCPVSHQPYVYVPEGLASPTSDRRLVLYDSVAAHQGIRWAILIRPAAPGQVPAAWVVPLNEAMLQLYLPANVPPLK